MVFLAAVQVFYGIFRTKSEERELVVDTLTVTDFPTKDAPTQKKLWCLSGKLLKGVVQKWPVKRM